MDYRVVEDLGTGLKRLDPIPTSEDLDGFYESRYYDLMRSGGRAPDVRRLLEGGPRAEEERAWQRHVLFGDIRDALSRWAPDGPVLDIGCGTGELVAFLCEQGLDARGVEPSTAAVEAAHRLGRSTVSCDTSDRVVAESVSTAERYAAVSLLHVLEHVPDPVATLRGLTRVLLPGGLLIIKVPNDFNELQLAAVRSLGLDEWWVAAPDHITYFDFPSLRRTLQSIGIEVLSETGDFPMEVFLLMGDDYISDPSLGEVCHAKRVSFEMRTPADVRRRLYASLAASGLGRSCLVVGRMTS